MTVNWLRNDRCENERANLQSEVGAVEMLRIDLFIVLTVLQCLALLLGHAAETNSQELTKRVEEELNKEIVWGQFTNGIKAGVWAESFNSADARLFPAFKGASTNDIMMWLAPREAWKIELRASTGALVRKTKLGRRWGREAKVGPKGPHASGFIAIRANSFPYLTGKGFKLSELFDIENPGKYTLKIAFCGMVVTNKQVAPTDFGTIAVNLHYYVFP